MRKETVVRLSDGLHARPASKIAEIFQDYEVECFIYVASGERAKLKSTLDILSLGVKHGQKVLLEYPEEADELITKTIAILENQ